MIISEQLQPYFIHYNEQTIKKLLKQFSHEEIINSTSHILPIITDKDIKERIYIILNNIIQLPTCKLCGNKVNFHSITKGYYKYCSLKCSSKDTSENRVESIRKSQGENAFKIKTPLTKERQQIANDRRKQTTLDRYGVESYMQTLEFRQSISNAAMEQYGVEYFTRAKEVQEQTKQTCIERYGYENQMQSSIIQQKSKDTCLEKYGYEHASQSPDIWKKGMDTFKERYGVVSNFGRPEVRDKSLKVKIERYGTPNPSLLSQGFSEISQEFCELLYSRLPENLQKYSHYFKNGRETWIRYKIKEHNNYFFYDFSIMNLKILIEFQGDYWHKNPQIYEYNLENLSIWLKDEFKKEIAEENGFQVFYVWESDYKKDKDKCVNELLQKILLINNETTNIENK